MLFEFVGWWVCSVLEVVVHLVDEFLGCDGWSGVVGVVGDVDECSPCWAAYEGVVGEDGVEGFLVFVVLFVLWCVEYGPDSFVSAVGSGVLDVDFDGAVGFGLFVSFFEVLDGWGLCEECLCFGGGGLFGLGCFLGGLFFRGAGHLGSFYVSGVSLRCVS